MQVSPLQKEEGKMSKGQMASCQITSLLSAERKWRRPPDLEQATSRLRLQRRIMKAQDLPGLWLLIEQQKDAAGTDIQRMSLAGNRRTLPHLFCD